MYHSAKVLTALILLGAGQANGSDQTWEIHGQVVDGQSVPVDDFEVATFWSSNGKQWDETGKWIEMKGMSDAGKFWKEEGVLAAHPNHTATRLQNGKFNLSVKNQPRVTVFAMDKSQTRGGFVSVEKSAAEKSITIKLVPLVRVHGTIYCPEAERTPDWTMAIVHPPGDQGNYLHFTHCGSIRGKFSFLLPPGKYDFDVYSESPDARVPKPNENKAKDSSADIPAYVQSIPIEVPAGAEFDMGVLDVELYKDKHGIARDYSQFYGKQPPELAITDARGVAKEVKLADFRGKWVLLDFWGVRCLPCLGSSLPELTKFYEEHTADRDRFEILSICNTEDEKVQTIEALDTLLAPLVKDIWDGKQLPFPVLIDGEGKTFGVYGIHSSPTVLLIDPEGHLVKNGDEAMLAEKLKEQKP